MLWCALCRNLWMFRSIIATFVLDGAHLFATVSSTYLLRPTQSHICLLFVFCFQVNLCPPRVIFCSCWGLVAFFASPFYHSKKRRNTSPRPVIFDCLCRGEVHWPKGSLSKVQDDVELVWLDAVEEIGMFTCRLSDRIWPCRNSISVSNAGKLHVFANGGSVWMIRSRLCCESNPQTFGPPLCIFLLNTSVHHRLFLSYFEIHYCLFFLFTFQRRNISNIGKFILKRVLHECMFTWEVM